MKITKFIHSCLLVEMPEPVNRTALFDPGVMSEAVLNVDDLKFLDDIFITHEHSDHLSVSLLKKLRAKFPNARITGPPSVVDQLKQEGIEASSQVPDGVVLFDSPHEDVKPMFPNPPEEYGYHYLDKLSVPGDSHSFHETKAILALAVSAPWGSMIAAMKLALELKPQHILPVHDWHWNEDARQDSYERMERIFKEAGITFHKLETGVPIIIDI